MRTYVSQHKFLKGLYLCEQTDDNIDNKNYPYLAVELPISQTSRKLGWVDLLQRDYLEVRLSVYSKIYYDENLNEYVFTKNEDYAENKNVLDYNSIPAINQIEAACKTFLQSIIARFVVECDDNLLDFCYDSETEILYETIYDNTLDDVVQVSCTFQVFITNPIECSYENFYK